MKVERALLVFGLVGLFLCLPNFAISKELKPGDPGYKDPAIAALISFVILGGGQIYVGDITRGLIFLFAGYAAIFIGALLISWVIFWVGWLAVGIYSVYDAYNLAKKYNAQGGKLKVTEVGVPNPEPTMAF